MQKLFKVGAASVVGALLMDYRNICKNEKKKEKSKFTKTYIWGNGIYQARPDAIMQFKNFEPKLIENFLGKKTTNLQKVFFGQNHEAGIDTEGNVFIWLKKPLDANKDQKGSDNIRENVIKISPKNEKFQQLAFTQGFVWGLSQAGHVYQWKIKTEAAKIEGKEPTIEIEKEARQIKSLPANIKQISAGLDHFAVLTESGKVFMMGDDTFGQCGLGADKRQSSPPFYEQRVRNPKEVQGLEKIVKVVCGNNHTLAVSETGLLYGWGSNQTLQLSHEEEFSKVMNPLLAIFEPLRVSKKMENIRVYDAAAGEGYSIIVGENKESKETEVYGCGFNLHGECGSGYLKHVTDVMKIEALSNYTLTNKNKGTEIVKIDQISCGNNHCMALLNIGAVMEWGENEFGQLGNKKRVFSEHPLIIGFFKNQTHLFINCGQTSSGVVCENNDSM